MKSQDRVTKYHAGILNEIQEEKKNYEKIHIYWLKKKIFENSDSSKVSLFCVS